MGVGGVRVVERQSRIAAPAARVWARVVTPEGINDELRPWMTMSMPRGAGALTVDTIPVGTPVGRSWLRLFGVVPFDYDHLMIAELEPGRRFHEESTMLSMRMWRHERTVSPDGAAHALVHDRVTFRLRLPCCPPRPWWRPASGPCSVTGTAGWRATSAAGERRGRTVLIGRALAMPGSDFTVS